ncbi:MAG: site-2 protease family protein [Tepidisphaeraceae bacterium]
MPTSVERMPAARPQFYKVDASRVSLREFWFETRVFFWVGLIIKAFRLKPRGSTDDWAVQSILPFEADPSRLGEDVLSRFDATLDRLYALDFGPPTWFDQDDPFQATHNTVAALMQYDGRAIARVQRRTNFARVPAKVKFTTTFVTPTTNGGFIVTGNGKYDMLWPDSHDTLRFPGLDVEAVWTKHLERIDAAAAPRITRHSSAEVAEAYHVSLREFHVARGVFQPLGEEELEMVAPPPVPATPSPLPDPSADTPPALAAATVVAPDAPMDHMENATLDELRKLQKKQANWVVTVLLLFLSGLLFVVNSRQGNSSEQNWEFIGTIVGILLFHECGHYLAMKLFGYRNLRMFFIPGFGAAVSGRHYNAAAWKKIVVSLMGPLPGIAVGVGILVASVWRQDDLLYRIGLMAVGLNAFNLLPVLPLDGGWVAHAALFARHPKLDVGFRLITALLMIASGVFLPGFKLLMYFGIASLFTLPIAFRRAQIVRELRSVPGIGVSPDDQSIPTDTARAILVRVRDRFRFNLNAKMAAQHVAEVFESLNARPPNVLATLGLLTLHAGGFFLAALSLLVAVALHDRANFNEFAMGHTYPVSAATIQTVGTPPADRHVVALQFKSDAETIKAISELPAGRAYTRFGQALLVDFAADEKTAERAMFAAFENRTADAFVANDKNYLAANLTFKWPETEAAKQSFDELAAYMTLARWDLAPTWAAPDVWPQGDRQEMAFYRRLAGALQKLPPLPENSGREFYQKRDAARRRGDDQEVERLDAEQKAATDEALKAYDKTIVEQFGHPEFVQQWRQIEQIKKFPDREKEFKTKIAPLLGIQRGGGKTLQYGLAYQSQLHGYSVGGTFVDGEASLVRLTQWLISQGATDLKYQIEGAPAADDNEPEPEE